MSEKYNVINGTSYDVRTPNQVFNVLEECRLSKTRIILDYGHTRLMKDESPDLLGKSFGERYDITGTVGRSMGPCKVPILLHNARSMGGVHILDHCIVRILSSKGKRVLYQHPNYQPFG